MLMTKEDISMPLLENITKAEKSLIVEQEIYNSILNNLRVTGKRIHFKKIKIVKKYKKLRRVTKRHNLDYSRMVEIISIEAERRKNEDYHKELDSLGRQAIELGGDSIKHIQSVYQPVRSKVPRNVNTNVNRIQHNTVVPIFTNKRYIFKHALNKIVKLIAAKRLMEIGLLEDVSTNK